MTEKTTLEEVRKEWEKYGEVVFHHAICFDDGTPHTALTVIYHKEPQYRQPYYDCLRYFPINGDWQLSQDLETNYAEEAFKWVQAALS